MKWLFYILLVGLMAGSWMMFARSGKEMKEIDRQIMELQQKGDPENKSAELSTKKESVDGQRTIEGILLTFLSAGVVGIVVVVYLLPFFAQRVTHAVYDSGEMMEKDVMHDARSLLAQGDYEGAISAFQSAAAADPLNRLPWVEIAKIQKDNMGDPQAAIGTIRHALESQAWEVNDAAYFLFRLAELYNEVDGDRASAVAIMNQVVEQFPSTRHSANAKTKLHDWAVEDEAAAAAGEEAEYLAQAEQAARSIEEEEAEFLARMKRDGENQPPA